MAGKVTLRRHRDERTCMLLERRPLPNISLVKTLPELAYGSILTVVIDDHCLSVVQVKTLPDLNPAQIAERRLNCDEGLWYALWDGITSLGKFYLYLTRLLV